MVCCTCCRDSTSTSSGYTDRLAILTPEQAKRLVPGNNGMFLASIVASDGRVLGAWRKAEGKAGATITAEPFEDGGGVPPGPFEAAAKRYAAFLGMELAGVS